MLEAKYASALHTALHYWETVARANGWTVRALTVWVDKHGHIQDSVGTQQTFDDGAPPRAWVVGPSGETFYSVPLSDIHHKSYSGGGES